MRQKKSKKIFYIAGLIILAGFLFLISKESNVKTEQIEVKLENNFVK